MTRRIALLDIQRSEVDFGGDFAGSRELQFAASDLRLRGHDVVLMRQIVGVLGQHWDEGARQRLRARLDGFGAGVLKVHVDADFIAGLRADGVHAVFLAGALIDPPVGTYDAVVQASARWPLVDALEAWAEDRRSDALALPPSPGADPFADEEHFAPATEFVDEDGTVRPYARFALVTNRGYPYAADPDDSPAFEGVDLQGPLRRLGCTFCEMGGDYRRLAVPDYLGFLRHQIRYYAERAPGAEVLLGDEAGADILGALLDRLVDGDVPPARILVKARADGLLARADRFRRSLTRARAAGHSVVLFLVGLENFSAAELLRFNKGITSADLDRCLELLGSLEAEFGDAFSLRRYTGHGFVLWTPWTTLEDLEQNLAGFDRHDLRTLSSKAPFSRLRLHPWAPLHRLAERDGLLDPEGRTGLRHHLGYATDEVPWRFADPAAALVYELLSAGIEAQGEATAFELLADAVVAVRELESLPPDAFALAAAFAARVPTRRLPSGAELTAAVRRLAAADKLEPYRFVRAEVAEDGPILRFRAGNRDLVLLLEGRRARALDSADAPFAAVLTDAIAQAASSATAMNTAIHSGSK